MLPPRSRTVIIILILYPYANFFSSKNARFIAFKTILRIRYKKPKIKCIIFGFFYNRFTIANQCFLTYSSYLNGYCSVSITSPVCVSSHSESLSRLGKYVSASKL